MPGEETSSSSSHLVLSEEKEGGGEIFGRKFGGGGGGIGDDLYWMDGRRGKGREGGAIVHPDFMGIFENGRREGEKRAAGAD